MELFQFADKLAHLVGDYQSDSDNDDTEHRQGALGSVTTGEWIYPIVLIWLSLNGVNCFLDWTQCTDASSGHPYYWNIVTKDVTWEMPIEYQRLLEQVAINNPQSLRKWILCYTDDNTPYYFNEVTREISWEKPDDFIEPSSSGLNNELPDKSRSNSRQSNISESVSQSC